MKVPLNDRVWTIDLEIWSEFSGQGLISQVEGGWPHVYRIVKGRISGGEKVRQTRRTTAVPLLSDTARHPTGLAKSNVYNNDFSQLYRDSVLTFTYKNRYETLRLDKD